MDIRIKAVIFRKSPFVLGFSRVSYLLKGVGPPVNLGRFSSVFNLHLQKYDGSKTIVCAKKQVQSILPLLSKPIIPYLADWRGEPFPELADAAMVMLQPNELDQLSSTIDLIAGSPLDSIPIFLHLDLIRGISRDEAALRYIASLGRFRGIITVHHHLVSAAHRLGLNCIVRLFLQDTRGVERGVGVIAKSRPDVVELLPAIAAPHVSEQFDKIDVPRMAGGLISDEQSAREVLASGCLSISSTKRELWKMNAK
jgi:glycerol uptake operon antiterminator